MINQILKILNFRLIEFGDTPSSALTLEEFMTVDLEEEQDPPAFKAARKKDRERLQKVKKKKIRHIFKSYRIVTLIFFFNLLYFVIFAFINFS